MEITKQCKCYDEHVGCYNTFDGQCNQEQCQVYNLLKQTQKDKCRIINQQQLLDKIEVSVAQLCNNLRYVEDSEMEQQLAQEVVIWIRTERDKYAE